MKITFTDSEIGCTQEYKFWKYATDKLIMNSPSGRSDLIAKYLYDNYEMIIEDCMMGNRYGPLNLRSVECPDKTETFLRLKYKRFI